MIASLLFATLVAAPACSPGDGGSHLRVLVSMKGGAVERSARRLAGPLPKLPLGEEPGRDAWVAVLEDQKGRALFRASFPAPNVLRAPPGSKPSVILRDEGASSVRVPACSGAVTLRLFAPAWTLRSGALETTAELVEVASWPWRE